MLSIKPMGLAGKSLVNYWLELSREDYYTQGAEPPGRWMGSGAALLQLRGEVEPEILRSALAGKSPKNEALVQGAGDGHRAGWDFCFSAPKSVSVLWALGSQESRESIESAQKNAVLAGISHLENVALSRRGRAGVDKERSAGLIAAAFDQ